MAFCRCFGTLVAGMGAKDRDRRRPEEASTQTARRHHHQHDREPQEKEGWCAMQKIKKKKSANLELSYCIYTVVAEAIAVYAYPFYDRFFTPIYNRKNPSVRCRKKKKLNYFFPLHPNRSTTRKRRGHQKRWDRRVDAKKARKRTSGKCA